MGALLIGLNSFGLAMFVGLEIHEAADTAHPADAGSGRPGTMMVFMDAKNALQAIAAELKSAAAA